MRTPATAREVAQRIERGLRTEPLRRFERVWQVSAGQAAAMFGVSRQAYAKWSTAMPADRLVAVAMLGGLSLLELAQQHGFVDLRDAVRSMFDITRVQP